MNIWKKFKKRFLDEKIGEQDIYQENVKQLHPSIEPIKDITMYQNEILQSQPSTTASRTLLTIEDVPSSPNTSKYESLNLWKKSFKYLKAMSSCTKYDNAFGIKKIEISVDFKLGNEYVKIDGNNLTLN